MNEMKACDFGAELTHLLTEFKKDGTFEQVPFAEGPGDERVGIAAGPHTQTAAGIISCWAAGAGVIELKTVQVLSGKELGLTKPCIYVGDAVYNTEWSSEFPAETAAEEYIGAYLLIRVLSKEFSLERLPRLVASVGYDLKGIKSKPVTAFLCSMKDASENAAWKRDIKYLRKHVKEFSRVTAKDIDAIEKETCIADTVTLSTMHGCPREEVYDIASYLLGQGFHTFVKLNPTIIGRENVYKLLKAHGFEEEIPESVFEQELGMNAAVDLIERLSADAYRQDLCFGVKLTNTLPVAIKKQELSGSTMYLSGKALYSLSLMAAGLIAATCPGVPISFSGGADRWNVGNLLYAGICTVTVCSILLKAGGYKNFLPLLEAAQSVPYTRHPNHVLLHELSEKALTDPHYDAAVRKVQERLPRYSPRCAFCENCVDVCPNRANVRLAVNGGFAVRHIEERCNECGVCAASCRLGHEPYKEKEAWKGAFSDGL